MLRQPFFKSMSAPGEIKNATAYSGRFRELGFRTGYAWPETIHDFRVLGLYLIRMYTNSAPILELINIYQDHLYPQVSMEKFAGQKGSDTFLTTIYLTLLAMDKVAISALGCAALLTIYFCL